MEALTADLMKMLIGLGPGGAIAAFAFYNWREERNERRELAAQNVKLLEDTISSRIDLANALAKIAAKIGA